MDNCFAGGDAPAENARHTSGRAPRRRLLLIERSNGRRGEIKDRPFKELELNERIGDVARFSPLVVYKASPSTRGRTNEIDIRALFSFFRVLSVYKYYCAKAINLEDNSDITLQSW